MLGAFNAAPHAVLTPSHKVVFDATRICTFPTVINHGIQVFLEREACQRGCDPKGLSITGLDEITTLEITPLLKPKIKFEQNKANIFRA